MSLKYQGIILSDGQEFTVGVKLPSIRMNQIVQGAAVESITWEEGREDGMSTVKVTMEDTPNFFVAIDPDNIMSALMEIVPTVFVDTAETLGLPSKDEQIEVKKAEMKKTVEAIRYAPGKKTRKN